ncbi:MAG: Na/Pi cotransporter family protein [Oscillospiraceae bacterium]
MDGNIKIVFGLVGGLAMFLYGMNSMSDALQKAAGEKMKKVLGFLTKNPIMGALAGALVTAVLQSSSATTVMVIGFVSAGLMTLPQAISVIFGANIGTTMTAQLMAFKISNYIYPIIFIGFILYFVSKREKVKNIGMVIFSFGLLFEGIEIMGGVMKPLAGSPIFTDLMGKVSEIPVLGILLGAVMTVVVQSSSATIAVLQNFASQAGPDGVTSVIGLAGAIPILLGDNIGTTITALLASIGQSKNAKRTAIAHSVFNISGSILFAFLIPLLAKFVQFISPKGNEVDVIARQIANAHTTFNIVCTLIWLPLIPLMVKIVTLIVKGEDKNIFSDSKPRFLDEKLIGQPVAAMFLVSEEIRRFSEFGASLLYKTRALFESGNSDVVRSDFSRDYSTIKNLHDSISSYITKMLSSGNLTEAQSEQTAGLLFVTNNIERISDRCFDMSEVLNKLSGKKKLLSKAAVSELGECFDIADELFEKAMLSVENGDEDYTKRVSKGKEKMRKTQKKLNKAHLSRVKKKDCDAALTPEYTDILHSLDRIADNCIGIAEEAADNISFIDLRDEAQSAAELISGGAECVTV